MQAEIITIGDELLIGQVVNTNQAFIAERLNGIGISVGKMTTVGDSEEAILRVFERALQECEVVIVTGGLGPTHDDITKDVLCKFFHTDLVIDQNVLEAIKSIMSRRNIPLTKASEGQAMVPRGCTVFPNSTGSAPGILFERGNRYLVAMPGVPFEMKSIMEESIIPFFRSRVSGRVIRHRTLKTTGIAESVLASRIGNVEEFLDGATLAFLPSPYGTRLRISVDEPSEAAAGRKIEAIENVIRSKAGKYIYAAGEEELEETIGRIMTERKLTIAVAESCTGGLIAHRLTNVPGSSDYFERGVTAYSNESKVQILGVPAVLIAKHGAVSREVAEAMAEGIRISSKTSIGISTTGIAGPSGGTPEKPVGLVWIGYADAEGSFALQFNFGKDRIRTKERASQAALELVRRRVLDIGVEPS